MANRLKPTIGGHKIPEWAKCYCVKRHFPTYMHVLPFEMPGGDLLYLCPASHHSLTVFLQICEQLGGPPAPGSVTYSSFPIVVRRLGQMIWAVQQGDLSTEQYMRMETYKRLSRSIDG